MCGLWPVLTPGLGQKGGDSSTRQSPDQPDHRERERERERERDGVWTVWVLGRSGLR